MEHSFDKLKMKINHQLKSKREFVLKTCLNMRRRIHIKGQIILCVLSSAFPLCSWSSEVKIHHRTDFSSIQQEVRKEVLRQFSQLYKMDCSTEPTSKKTPSGYLCGEVPFGEIINQQEKSLFGFELKKGLIRSLKGGRVNLSQDAQFDLRLRRSFERSESRISLIEQKKEENVKIMGRIDRNVFIRTSPHGQVLWTHACLYLPQLRLQVPKQTLRFDGYQKKKFIFKSIKGKFTASADVSGGQIIIRESKVCSVYRTTMEGPSVEKLRPKTELVKMGLPEILKMDIQGLKVSNTKAKLKGTFAKIFSSVLKTIGVADIPKMIRSEVQRAVQKEINRQLQVTEQDIVSGEWLRKTFASLFSESTITRNTSKAFREATQSAVQEARRIPTTFNDDCQRALTGRGVSINAQQAERFCASLVNEVTFKPFARWKRYVDRGCYDHKFPVFAYPDQPKNQSWSKECAVMSTVTLVGSEASTRSRQCLANQFRDGKSRGTAQTACRDHLIADYLGLEKVWQAQNILKSTNPQQQLSRWNYNQSQIAEIARKLRR